MMSKIINQLISGLNIWRIIQNDYQMMEKGGIIITSDNIIKMKKIMEFTLYFKLEDIIGEYVKREE